MGNRVSETFAILRGGCSAAFIFLKNLNSLSTLPLHICTCARASAFFIFFFSNYKTKRKRWRSRGGRALDESSMTLATLRVLFPPGKSQIVSLGIIPTEANKTAERRGGHSYVDELRIYLAYLLNGASHPR